MLARTICLAAVLAAFVQGCSSMPPAVRHTLTAAYVPVNVFQKAPKFPPNMRRVAVLPLPQSRTDADQAAGVDMLEPLLISELRKRNSLEIIPVSPSTMQELTGRRFWFAEEPLPPDFMARLRKATACDAVLFTSLAGYQAYPPLRTAWKLRLVDCTEQQTWWAVDENFDAGSESVAVAAEAYARRNLNLPNPLLEDTGVLHSPLRFGQYTLSAVAKTMPER